MGEYKLHLTDIDAPPIIVPGISVETYFALGEEQAGREHVRRCINPQLPDNHHVYSVMHDLPESMYESKEFTYSSTIWKIKKENSDEIVQRLGLKDSDYPYEQALDMIEGDYFWIIAWDD